MHVHSIKITNYKSFRESEEIQFAPGINVLIGKNNSGKTALLEALSLRFLNKPHRSEKTIPTPRRAPAQSSTVKIKLRLEYADFVSLFEVHHAFSVPGEFVFGDRTESDSNVLARDFPNKLQAPRLLTFEVSGRPQDSGIGTPLNYILEGLPEKTSSPVNFEYVPDPPTFKIVKGSGVLPSQDDIVRLMTVSLLPRFYRFNATRIPSDVGSGGDGKTLEPDARNLSQVLSGLMGQQPSKFKRLNKHFQDIFHDMSSLTVTPPSWPQQNSNPPMTHVLPVPTNSPRDDLAQSLMDCGTGIGQVLSILYVVVANEMPMVLLIDEPQSFLHPGAVRKLFQIFREYSQHQYIVSSHSPLALTAAEPERILVMAKEGFETAVRRLDFGEIEEKRALLSELGVSISDVFGADQIVWVEGKTEERAFSMLLRQSGIDRGGIGVVGVLETASFFGKDAAKTVAVYQKLSQGVGIIPPAVGFIFDGEHKKVVGEAILKLPAPAPVRFLPRRMFENYLLHAGAIARVVREADTDHSHDLTEEAVQQSVDKHRKDRKLLSHGSATIKNDATWQTNIDGAKLLDLVFGDLTNHRVEFQKTKHSVALAKYLVENAPQELEEVTSILKEILSNRRAEKQKG